MAWSFLCTVVFLVILFWIKRKCKISRDLFFLVAICGTGMVFSLSMIATLAITSIFLPDYTEEWQQQEVINLVSLRDQAGMEGSLMIGSVVGSKQYYYFYKEVGKGYQAGQVLVGDNVTIYENDGSKNGQLKIFVSSFSSPYDEGIISLWVLYPMKPRSRVKYEFFIPKGSLKRNFAL